MRNLIKENYWSDGRFDYTAMNHMVEGLQITGQMKGDVDWPKYVDTSYLPPDLRPHPMSDRAVSEPSHVALSGVVRQYEGPPEYMRSARST